MSVKNIEIYGSKTLRTKSEPVKKISNRIKNLIKDMYETMASKNGIGLAAPQIGVNLRVIVINVPVEKKNYIMSLINPIIKKKEGAVEFEEGCLSIPDIYINITRPKKIKIEYLDEDGQKKEIEAEDLLARVILHEIDHLNGVLMVDKICDKEKKNEINQTFGVNKNK